MRIESDKFREMSLLNSSDIDQLRQEMDKMNEAYVEAYEQIETLRAEL